MLSTILFSVVMYANVNKSKILYSTTFYDKEVYKCVGLFLQSYSIVLYSAVLCIAAIKYQVCPLWISRQSEC